MSYRKITVDEKEYEYVIGKGVTKIKGVGIFDHRQWAYCIDPDREFRVSPKHVRGMILGVPCPGHDPTTRSEDYYNDSDYYYNYLGDDYV